jgi:hypothetical protein
VHGIPYSGLQSEIQGAAEWTPVFQWIIQKERNKLQKKLYIFEKYLKSSFFPLGFENNITQVAAVIRGAFL